MQRQPREKSRAQSIPYEKFSYNVDSIISIHPALPELVHGGDVWVPSSCRERFRKCSSNEMPKRIRECRCRASPLLRSAVSRIVEVAIRKSRRRLRCLAFQTTGKRSQTYLLGAVKTATNAVGCVVCCGSSHFVLHGLGTTSRVSAGNS